MNRSRENPMTLKNLGLGLLLAAALIAPSLAHADATVTRERFSDGIAPSLHFIMFDQPAKFDAAPAAFPAD
jgi:hypothetical protein